jgi:tRNA 2-thiouridine synthesizing protein A
MSTGWSGRPFGRARTQHLSPEPGVDVDADPREVPVLTIDALGRKCPIPIIMLAERIRDVPIGRIVAVLADDPAARTDLPAWCMMKSQEFVVETELPRGWSFHIRRSY